MDAMEAILSRRSTRAFADKLPETALIEKVIEAGRHAPSGSNSQTTHFIVITDKEILSELAVTVRNAFASIVRPRTQAIASAMT